MEKFLLIAFDSTHMAIKIEKKLADLDVDVIPTPRELTAACGISIKAKMSDFEQIKAIIGQDLGKMNRFYEMVKIDKKLMFKEL